MSRSLTSLPWHQVTGKHKPATRTPLNTTPQQHSRPPTTRSAVTPNSTIAPTNVNELTFLGLRHAQQSNPRPKRTLARPTNPVTHRDPNPKPNPVTHRDPSPSPDTYRDPSPNPNLNFTQTLT
eukprot:1363238-Amorphochlora_amoeboformis.AAC.1